MSAAVVGLGMGQCCGARDREDLSPLSTPRAAALTAGSQRSAPVLAEGAGSFGAAAGAPPPRAAPALEASQRGVDEAGSPDPACRVPLVLTPDATLQSAVAFAAVGPGDVCVDVGCGHGKGLPSLMQRVPRLLSGAAPCHDVTRACNLYDTARGLEALERLVALRPHVGCWLSSVRRARNPRRRDPGTSSFRRDTCTFWSWRNRGGSLVLWRWWCTGSPSY